jgi:hypothetical protein
MQSRQVSVELLNKILNYLATRPYIEVVELIEAIRTIPEEKKEVATTVKK